MKTRRSIFLQGLRDELPILAGTIPFGLIYSVTAVQAHLPPLFVQGMSAIVFAGSAQFIIVQLASAGIPALIIAVTATILNLRHMLYSASLAPDLTRLPTRWKALLSYLLTDEAYAVTVIHYQRTEDYPHRHWYFLGAGLALWGSWQLSTAAGILLGAQIPASWSLDFALPLTFIALVVPALRDRAGIIAALVGGTAAVLAAHLPLKLGLVAAIFVGIAAGLATERRGQTIPTALAPAPEDIL
ncbi:MAG: AzlC family ABC transporter permease [Ktedonobacterales bacterium]|nr:AzlC family ABC transporter permease [Ktedonobacterales bacterium]